MQVNPSALSSYGLTLEDVRSAVGAANVNQAKGTFNGPLQAYTIGANDQLKSSAEYRPVVLAYKNGNPVHLSDVANVIDDTENTRQAAWMNTTPAVILNIQRQPGANIIAVVDRIKTLLPQLKASIPPAVSIDILTDRTTTIRASVADVEFELILTVIPGGGGDLRVPAHHPGHHHPQRGGAPVPGGHLRGPCTCSATA